MKSNFAFTALTVSSRLLVGFLLFLLLARLWGPAQFGQFAFVFSVCALLVLIVDFGFGVYLLREIAARREQASALVADALSAKLLLVIACAAASLVAAALAGPSVLPPALLLPMLIAALAMSFADFFVAPLRALGLFKAECALVVLANLLHFALAGGVAWRGGGVDEVAWTMVASRLAFMGMAGFFLSRVLPDLKRRGSLLRLRGGTLKRVFPYGLDGTLAVAWTQLDVVLVRLLFGQQAVGLYGAGQKVVLGVGALAPVVGNVMIPRMAALAATRSKGFWTAAGQAATLLVGIGLVFALPMILLSTQLVSLFLGPAYRDLADLLPMFGVVLLVRYVGAGAGVAITAAGLQTRRVIAQILGLCAVGLLVPMIPVLGLGLRAFLGVYVAGLSTMAIGYGWWLWRLARDYETRPLP